ncbi:MAG TPA: bifunctional adenosylcobinamide kinase/adenosylcobinamide-phosphate guanylyltransferase [Actinomycetota bacterium]|jgi:adenosyl cobinamide kinase/adenosyl cobinamide phosphate guanylyltransferase|nr:bifunctional adenosylcobinamide kinase/adenosylcobinamide-phosphate guanylyltransferase [Actinomycetota bacterium]
MSLAVLIGGVRSGKSRLAVDMAARESKPVVFIATAEARDEEMAARIAGHRTERPAQWTTVEEPVGVQRWLEAVTDDDVVVIDCLTLWVSNLLERNADVEEAARRAAETAAKRSGLVVAVTNEVGSGLVPASAAGREYTDVLGRVNTIWAENADRVWLVVAGKVLPLQDAPQ